jgi:hypothetical protein
MANFRAYPNPGPPRVEEPAPVKAKAAKEAKPKIPLSRYEVRQFRFWAKTCGMSAKEVRKVLSGVEMEPMKKHEYKCMNW